jgi:hypothetical protein
MSWLVTFTLTEFLSVAEKKRPQQVKMRPVSAGGWRFHPVGGFGGVRGKNDLVRKKVLKPVNDALGDE